MTARDDMQARIRAAVASPSPHAPFSPAYRRSSDLSSADLRARLRQRLADYHVGVHQAADESDIACVAERIVADRRIATLAVPPDLPHAWRPRTIGVVEDHRLSHAALDAIEGAMTGCLLAVAESGTIVLNGGVGQGRRALTLLPDYHLCIVRAADVVGLLPEAMQRLRAAVAAGAPLTFVSGPSATADIELDRVEGVHGPRRLDVILVD